MNIFKAATYPWNRKTPKVSVIIPVYNAEEFVEKCVRSVLSQTLSDLEVICIDDGSVDGSPRILDALSAEDRRVRVIHQENRGIGPARNAGIEAARGEYVHFLDADDAMLPESYEELCAFADENRLDAVFFSRETVFEDETLAEQYVYEKTIGLKKEEYPIASGLDMLCRFTENKDYNTSCCPLLLRREFIQAENLLFLDSGHEDLHFTFAVLARAKLCGCLKKAYYLRYVHGDSIVTAASLHYKLYGYLNAMLHVRRIAETLELTEEQYAAVRVVIDNIRYNVARFYKALPQDDRTQFLQGLQTDERLFFDLAVSQYIQKKDKEKALQNLKDGILKLVGKA